MKKVFTLILCLMLGFGAIAQQKIQLRSADRAECTKSDMTSLKASFSFSTIEAVNVSTTRGEFSEIYINGSFPCGKIGEPQLPMLTKMIAIPTGATPVVAVDAYSEMEYTLSDYGIGKVSAMQAPVRKNIDPSTVEYAYSETAYARDSYNDNPIATVEVLGTMRGITLGRIIVQPVQYNPVAGTIKTFNDIEVSVDFQGGDATSTEQMFLNTFSPAFNSVYDQLFNLEMLTGGTRDAYTEHPDLYNAPVKMLVICYSGFQGNAALNSWLEWKLQKGYYVDIYYTGSGSNNAGTTSSAIASFIKTKYNASVAAGNAYTYLVVIGDTGQVPYYVADYQDSDVGYVASDLGYASVDFSTNSDDVFPDMYYSRISVENTTHLTNYINKVLTYEKYEFTDGGNYLNNVILVGGWDSSWTSIVAQPTINYATTNYFNSSNTTYGGFSGGTIKATISTSSTAGYSGSNNGCYQGINNGACFVNYTAHGDKQKWHQPLLSAKQVETLSNTGKYFFGVGNCCLTGNFNLDDASYSSSYAPSSSIGTTACFAETMIRVPNAGAIAYIGCSDYTIWMEDYYWAVGSGVHFTYSNNSYSINGTSTPSNSTMGVYDAMFTDNYWNSASSLLFLGNIAVTSAENNNTGYDVDEGYKYYFKYYHTFGDGSVMPYVTKPETNTVTIPSTVLATATSVTINALAGSYVAVTDNSSTIYGVAEANSNGVATVNFTNTIPTSGTLYVVVTRQQYQPYFGTITVTAPNVPQYTITASANPTAGGTIEGAGTYYENTQCTLTAVANHSYAFERWNDNNTDNPRTITVTGNATYTAYFRQLEEHHCTYNPQQTHGTISVSPENAYAGDEVTLTANPAAGYALDHWTVTTVTKEVIPVVDNKFIMPDSEVNITATFKSEPVELTVYAGSATNQYIPMYGYYFDDYTKSECIIPYHELSDMVGGTITAIAFYPSYVATTNNSWGAAEQTVFLKEVSDVNLGGSYSGTGGATVVKVGSPLDMPTAGEAYTITFDTPYTYEGGNLLIGVYNNKGSYNKVEWYGTGSLSSGVSAYGNSDSNLSGVTYNAQSFLPKTTFTYTPNENYCAKPDNLNVVGEIGPRTVTMGWDVASGDVFEYAMVSGHNIDPETVTYAGTTPTGEMTWNNLTPDSDYTVLIRRKCDDDNYSQPATLEFHTAVACPAPTGLAVSELATHGATFTWTGFSDSYVLMVGEPTTPGTVFNADFESGDLSGLGTFTNDATYPWTITTAKNHTEGGSYSMKSSNEGKNGTTSSIEVNVNLANDGTLSFYCWASCESASNEWDYGVFYIDDEEQDKFLLVTDWVNKSYALTAGQHTLTWTYSKDSSAAANDDCFYVDDITISGLVPSTWTEYTANTNSITINDLSANTYYFAKVKGNCNGDYSQDSDMVSFTTLESCPTPTNLTVVPGSITAHEATVTWDGDTDSYNVMLGEVTFMVNADFEDNQIPTNFTNSTGDLAWTVVANDHSGAYCAKSATGQNSATSALELSVDLEHSQTLTFSAKVSSESGYDEAFFSIDGTNKINGISGAGEWIDYQYTLTAGTHTLKWYYTKDSSVASNDDCFYVDDIMITGDPLVIETYEGITEKTYTLTGLEGESDYTVMVQGVCGEEPTGWSNAVSFTTLISCPAPTTLTAGTPGAHSVELNWNYTGDATTWQICLNGDEDNLIDVTTKPYTLTGLASGTTFTAKVRAYCDEYDQSIWSNTVTFTTDAACPTPTITGITAGSHTATISTNSEADNFNVRYRVASSVAPTTLTYDFENGWQDWTAVQGTTGTSPHNWMHNTEYTAYSSNGNVIDVSTSGYNDSEGFMLSESYISAATSGAFATGAVYPDNYLISPKIRLGGSMTFYAAGRTTDCAEKFTVMVSTTTNISDFVATSLTATLSSQTYTQYTVDLSSYSEMGEGYVIFHHYDCTDQHMLRIDDVVITEPAVGGNEWTEISGLTITGLDTETTYEAQLQANCGGEDGVSAWSSIVTFTTDVACPAPRNLTASNLTQNSATISWTGESESYSVQYRPATITGSTQTELFTEGFENDLAGWTTFALGYSSDLTNWQTYDATNLGSDYNNTNHGGDYVARSKSYGGSSVGDVTVDNWLISPQMTIGDGMTFWVSDDGEWHEHLEIRVCTAATFSQSTLTSDFALVAATAVSVEDMSWEEKTIDLSAYAGQTGYIAIRNNDNGKDFVCLDDITVYQTVNSYEYGTTNSVTTNTNSCNLTGLTPETLYEVKVQGDCGSEGTSLWSNPMYFTTPDACGAPTDLVASDITISSATLSWANTQDSYNLRYREVYFYEGFESETLPTGWTAIDANDDGNTWGIGFATAHTGNNGAFNLSYIYNTEGTTPDDYLVSPLLDLQGTLRVWLSGYGNDRYAEHFAIYVSTNGNSASDFTTTLVGETTTTNSYVEYTADLSSYEGQKGYIAIRHFNCTDQYYLYVDDFGLYGSENWVTVNNIGAATHPLVDLTPGVGYEWQVQGVDCNTSGDETEWSALATFSTPYGMTLDIAGYGTNATGGYHLIASPLSSTLTPSADNGFLATEASEYDLYKFDQSAEKEWVNWKNDGALNGFNIESGKGYLYANKQGTTLEFIGTKYNGTGAVALTYDEEATLKGWNLIGNPWGTTATLDMPFFRLNANGSALNADAGDGNIGAMEGVFVYAYDTELSQPIANATFTKSSSKADNRGDVSLVNIKVIRGRGVVDDNAIIRFDEGRTLPKFVLNEGTTKIYIPQEDNDYALARGNDNGSMPINFKASDIGRYTISVETKNINMSYLHLIDKLTGNDINLLTSPNYSFISSPRDDENRFVLVFRHNEVSDSFAYQSGSDIVVTGDGTLQVFDVMGRFVGTYEVHGVETIPAMTTGVYIFRMIGENVQTQKIVIR